MSKNSRIESSFNLFGLLDGTTLYGMIRVDGCPLVQRYNKDTDVFTPNFEAVGATKPILVAIIRDVASGNVLVPTALTWKYNGIDITFDPETHLSTNDGWQGVFEEDNSYSTKVGSTSYVLKAIKVLKNLVPISGYDNDRISVSGSVELGGHTFEFNQLNKDDVITEGA